MKICEVVQTEKGKIGSVRTRGGELYRFMKAEHARLDELLTQAGGWSDMADQAAYESFRERLLRHIRIEEKILLPMARRKQSGEPLPLAARLRLDHGALAALLMLPPVHHTVRAIRAVLEAHNPLEENDGGVYQQCEILADAGIDELLLQIMATPRIPVSCWVDSPKIVEAARRVLGRAGYDPVLLGRLTGS